ncbi:MAG: hypothetical protein HQK52_06495 [Oligoflexia bacterium]|nr:hypothetical protein [Oligoflexia bacterium]
MLTRLSHQSEDEKKIDLELKTSIEETLARVYQCYLNELSKKIEVYVKLFPTELLLITSLVDNKVESASALTLFISCDFEGNEGEKGLDKKKIHSLIDVAGLFWDKYFNEKGSATSLDITGVWEEVDFNEMKFYCKLSRENIALTLKADSLLK